MKLLLIHTLYQVKGGEDIVFAQEGDLLKKAVEVRELIFVNKSGPRGAIQFLKSIWNTRAADQVGNAISKYQPDIIHLHNFHYASGPLLIRRAKKEGIPVIITLHNYRLLCPSGTLLNKGKIFTDSLNRRFPWKAVFHSVYRNSVLQTFWLSFIIWFHKRIGTWNMVNRFIVLTDFSRYLFAHSTLGIPENKFITKPNFVPASSFVDEVIREKHFLYVGRLSAEKGILVLLEAFKKVDYSLLIIGDGPLKSDIETACEANKNITYLGLTDSESVKVAMRKCTALVFPSVWYETFGLSIIEALSCSTAVIASDIGGISTIVKHRYNGLLFKPNDVQAIVSALHEWVGTPVELKNEIYNNAERSYKENYGPKENLSQMLKIYGDVVMDSADH